jgi:hypothetical protein
MQHIDERSMLPAAGCGVEVIGVDKVREGVELLDMSGGYASFADALPIVFPFLEIEDNLRQSAERRSGDAGEMYA